MIEFLWNMQPSYFRLFLLVLCATGVISFVRSVRLARSLYRYSGDRTLPEHAIKGEPDPDLLAASALASQSRCQAADGRSMSSGFLSDRSNAKRVLYVLRVAESRFQYLWEKCYADAESIRRASLLTFLLSLVVVTYGVSPTFNDFHNGSRLTGGECLYLTLFEQFTRLAIGLSLSTALYLVSGFFERKLADRKTCWNYFCSRLKIEMSRE
jgi:hypothetical protein